MMFLHERKTKTPKMLGTLDKITQMKPIEIRGRNNKMGTLFQNKICKKKSSQKILAKFEVKNKTGTLPDC